MGPPSHEKLLFWGSCKVSFPSHQDGRESGSRKVAWKLLIFIAYFFAVHPLYLLICTDQELGTRLFRSFSALLANCMEAILAMRMAPFFFLYNFDLFHHVNWWETSLMDVLLSYFEKIAHMSVVWADVSLWLCIFETLYVRMFVARANKVEGTMSWC